MPATGGIESEAERAWLCQNGVGLAQGYLFSRPLPAEEFEAWHAAAKRGALRKDDGSS